ncbi:hypothetical protein M153_14230003, partial [Pseudoloma neurophilia]
RRHVVIKFIIVRLLLLHQNLGVKYFQILNCRPEALRQYYYSN